MLNELVRDFFRDKLRIAVMFGLYSVFFFAMWLYLDDEGFQVAAIILAGISVHQFYKYYLQKKESVRDSSE